MKVIDIIDRVAVRGNCAVLIFPNGFEISLKLPLSYNLMRGMPIEAEFCKTLLLKLIINGKTVFEKKKEDLLPEMEILLKELTLEAEDEKRTEINLESSRRLKNLLPLFKTRINVLMANNKSFMQPKDWIKELKSTETLQSIYLYFKEQGLFEKYKKLSTNTFPQLYPDIKKLDKSTAENVFILTCALLQDYANGINPEDECSVNANILTSRLLKVPNVIGEEVRVMDLANIAGI